jgi:hypothetical protein
VERVLFRDSTTEASGPKTKLAAIRFRQLHDRSHVGIGGDWRDPQRRVWVVVETLLDYFAWPGMKQSATVE